MVTVILPVHVLRVPVMTVYDDLLLVLPSRLEVGCRFLQQPADDHDGPGRDGRAGIRYPVGVRQIEQDTIQWDGQLGRDDLAQGGADTLTHVDGGRKHVNRSVRMFMQAYLRLDMVALATACESTAMQKQRETDAAQRLPRCPHGCPWLKLF